MAADPVPVPLLQVSDLRLEVPVGTSRRVLVDGVSFSIDPGERVALVGESGSGKSLTVLAALGLTPEPVRFAGGNIRVDGTDLRDLEPAAARRLRGGRLGIVFQEPSSALNPVLSIGYQIRETIQAHRSMKRGAARREALRLLDEVDLQPSYEMARAYPHQLSGGQAQRAALAVALAGAPSLLIADEPTTGLDTTARHGLLSLLLRLSRERCTALLLVTHDLAVASVTAQRCWIMYSGEIVETGPMDEILADPFHPYTRLLLRATVDNGPAPGAEEAPKADAAGGPPVCFFASRCPLREARCLTAHPLLLPLGPRRSLRCPIVARRRSP